VGFANLEILFDYAKTLPYALALALLLVPEKTPAAIRQLISPTIIGGQDVAPCGGPDQCKARTSIQATKHNTSGSGFASNVLQ